MPQSLSHCSYGSCVVTTLEKHECGKPNVMAAAPNKKQACHKKKRSKGKILNSREYLTSANNLPRLRMKKMSKERALGTMCKILDKVSGAKLKNKAKLNRARKNLNRVLFLGNSSFEKLGCLE